MTEQQQPDSPKRYTPSEFEDSIYQQWQDSGLFSPPPDGLRPTFTVMMPPPNVTGVLHMGHALNNSLQDAVVRHRRMTGYDVLWVPGTDHAGIATQSVVEKTLYRDQNLKRAEMGREAFVNEIWKWREHHGDVILSQLRKLGASCDWSRTKFTLDPEMSLAVRTAFVKMWEKKLVYRGSRLVNWDCKLETAVSDDEIEYVTRKGKMYTLRYPLADSDAYIDVATTRPETMLGDMGVAVHPDDKRYAHLVGKKIALPLTERLIPIVADESVAADYGTGAVKITPGHDPADYERGLRHKMPVMNILNGDGSMNEECGQFAGLPREEAREKVIAAFDELGLFLGAEDITHNVTISDRSKSVIEPLVSEQWFVRMSEMSKPAIDAVNNGSLNFKPQRWKKVYLDWLENVHDWCISRQLWWGHRIPVWYDEDGTPLASIEDVEIGSLHPETGKAIVRQDEDVLDTWASSWLWPFATLGWPDSESNKDLTRFYPTQFLSTGRDIIYLWVARMVMAGYAFLDDLPEVERCPFSTCYIHATVLDGQGRRMSKSAGNGIDPVEMIGKYGADAVRYSLMILTREGQDVKLADNRFELGLRFCNKIFNVAGFAMTHLEGDLTPPKSAAYTFEDKWIKSRLSHLTTVISNALETYEFHDAAQALYRFTTDDFCDWYVELSKPRLWAGEKEDATDEQRASAQAAKTTLGEVLRDLLKLLHPFTPFLTENLWADLPQEFREDRGLLMGSEWPIADKSAQDLEIEQQFDKLRDAVRAMRNVRALLEIPASETPEGVLHCENQGDIELFVAQSQIVTFTANLSGLDVQSVTESAPLATGTDVFNAGAVFLPVPIDSDTSKLRENLEKKLQKIKGGLSGLEKKLSNEKFIANADAEIVAGERQRMHELQVERTTVEANLQNL
ncbi:MAG: valyl-tRNA synthetase [Myxococcota bacterium]|jgi:valyl-tRNA synthetase